MISVISAARGASGPVSGVWQPAKGVWGPIRGSWGPDRGSRGQAERERGGADRQTDKWIFFPFYRSLSPIGAAAQKNQTDRQTDNVFGEIRGPYACVWIIWCLHLFFGGFDSKMLIFYLQQNCLICILSSEMQSISRQYMPCKFSMKRITYLF